MSISINESVLRDIRKGWICPCNLPHVVRTYSSVNLLNDIMTGEEAEKKLRTIWEQECPKESSFGRFILSHIETGKLSFVGDDYEN